MSKASWARSLLLHFVSADKCADAFFAAILKHEKLPGKSNR